MKKLKKAIHTISSGTMVSIRKTLKISYSTYKQTVKEIRGLKEMKK